MSSDPIRAHRTPDPATPGVRFATVVVMAEAAVVRRLPDPDPLLGAEPMPDALFEELVADSGERNGEAYQAIAEAEATWA
jgi:hypothetical protein